jgi:hypothetical protein
MDAFGYHARERVQVIDGTSQVQRGSNGKKKSTVQPPLEASTSRKQLKHLRLWFEVQRSISKRKETRAEL